MPTHERIRMFNTKETYPNQSLDNDLCQAVKAGNTVYVRGQIGTDFDGNLVGLCLLYTSPSPRDGLLSRMPSSA